MHQADARDAWITRAETSLFALALVLRRVPVREGSRRLHVRALELKRELARWRSETPERGEIDARLAEIERLTHEATEIARAPITMLAMRA